MNQYSLMPNLPGAAPLQTNYVASLRDQFAMAALTGLVLHPLLETAQWPTVAEAAYLVADAMLAARG